MARGAPLPDRPTSREFRRLTDLLRFVAPYRLRVVGGTLALMVSASTVLALGSGMRYLVDRGFGLGDPHILDQTVLALFCVTVIMALLGCLYMGSSTAFNSLMSSAVYVT